MNWRQPGGAVLSWASRGFSKGNCGSCKGTGKIAGKKCPVCKGHGRPKTAQVDGENVDGTGSPSDGNGGTGQNPLAPNDGAGPRSAGPPLRKIRSGVGRKGKTVEFREYTDKDGNKRIDTGSVNPRRTKVEAEGFEYRSEVVGLRPRENGAPRLEGGDPELREALQAVVDAFYESPLAERRELVAGIESRLAADVMPKEQPLAEFVATGCLAHGLGSVAPGHRAKYGDDALLQAEVADRLAKYESGAMAFARKRLMGVEPATAARTLVALNRGMYSDTVMAERLWESRIKEMQKAGRKAGRAAVSVSRRKQFLQAVATIEADDEAAETRGKNVVVPGPAV